MVIINLVAGSLCLGSMHAVGEKIGRNTVSDSLCVPSHTPNAGAGLVRAAFEPVTLFCEAISVSPHATS